MSLTQVFESVLRTSPRLATSTLEGKLPGPSGRLFGVAGGVALGVAGLLRLEKSAGMARR